MLTEAHSVTTVDLDLGYEPVSASIDLFRAHFGTTPGRYFGSRPIAANASRGPSG